MKKRQNLLFLSVLMLLTACQNSTKNSEQTAEMVLSTPSWVTQSQVKEGAVCVQDKGIYAKEKAYEIAINNCLIQLSDKQIQGQSQQTKQVTVIKQGAAEQVRHYGQSTNQFVVKAANSDHLSYELLGKYYDPLVEKVYVWVKLK